MKSRENLYVIVIATLALALITAILLGAWGLQVWGDKVNYDRLATLGNAISGPATFLAFGVAVVAIVIERIQIRDENRRLADERATAVVFWLSVQLIKFPDGREMFQWAIETDNATSAPIFQWRLSIDGLPSAKVCNHTKRPLLPGANTINVKELEGTLPNAMPQAKLTFMDRHGRVWSRTILGELTEERTVTKVCDHT